MQNFQSKSTGDIYAYDDDVIVTIASGTSTVSVNGVALASAPTDLEPYTPPVPSTEELLADAKTSKANEISSACAAHIISGFSSSALGAVHTYPSKATDQQNLNGSVVASLLPSNPPDWITLFWCADSSGAWALREHTAPQIQQVGKDAKDAVLAAIVKNGTLQLQIEAADTVENVYLIVW